jgi:hypothetical protein
MCQQLELLLRLGIGWSCRSMFLDNWFREVVIMRFLRMARVR